MRPMFGQSVRNINLRKKDEKGKLRMRMRTRNVNVRPRKRKKTHEITVFYLHSTYSKAVLGNKSSKERKIMAFRS